MPSKLPFISQCQLTETGFSGWLSKPVISANSKHKGRSRTQSNRRT